MNQARALDYHPYPSLPSIPRLRRPRLPPDLGPFCIGVIFGIIVTALEAAILARVCSQAAIGIARSLGFT
jgi:hypothetical protein